MSKHLTALESQERQAEDKLASAKSQGQAQFDSILEMVVELKRAQTAFDESPKKGPLGHVWKPVESARERIREDALSVEVRSGWCCPGDSQDGGHIPEEYCILLCTGGPAVRLVGELSEHCEPTSARLEVQDWFTPWTEFRPIADKAEHAKDKFSGYDSEPILLDYARCFWFGE